MFLGIGPPFRKKDKGKCTWAGGLGLTSGVEWGKGTVFPGMVGAESEPSSQCLMTHVIV